MAVLATPDLDATRRPQPAASTVAGDGGEVAGKTPDGPALDLHEGISDPGAGSTSWGCSRWPEHLRLQAQDGRLVLGRCKSANLCPYCARLAAVENSELLALDALNGVAPLIWAVLTTPSTAPEQRAYYDARRQVFRALRRRWPDCEIATVLEFTTGYGSHSGGARRPHWNVLIKGVPVAAVPEAHAVIASVWCPRQNASPDAQIVAPIYMHGGLMRYLALHFQKSEQTPPEGWSGHRFTASRGYLWLPTPEARRQARASLVRGRLVRLLDRECPDLDAQERAERVDQLMAEHHATEWELVRHTKLPSDWDDDGRPTAWTDEYFPVRQT